MTTLTPELLNGIDAYWRAANYLSVGQIYLADNPLLKRPLALGDVKRMLLGHWGTTYLSFRTQTNRRRSRALRRYQTFDPP